MKKYKSKIGKGIVGLLVFALGGSSVMMIIFQVWPVLIINLAVAAFIVYMFHTTYYIINGNDLIVRSAFLTNLTIKIDKIKKIKETNNPLSSPAASLDRIAIHYDTFRSVLISPKDKMDFITQLTTINPAIEVVFKNKKNKHISGAQ